MHNVHEVEQIPLVIQLWINVVTYIDNATRYCYVYLLHAKHEALDKFKIFKNEVELQKNVLIKTLWTDRGGEYYDPVFFQTCGIIHEMTTLYTPQ